MFWFYSTTLLSVLPSTRGDYLLFCCSRAQWANRFTLICATTLDRNFTNNFLFFFFRFQIKNLVSGRKRSVRYHSHAVFANRPASFTRQFKRRLGRVVHIGLHVGFPRLFRRVISIYKWEKEAYNPFDFPRLLAQEPPKNVLGLQMLAYVYCTHVCVCACVCMVWHRVRLLRGLCTRKKRKTQPSHPSGGKVRTSSKSTCGETRKPVRLNNVRVISDNDGAL